MPITIGSKPQADFSDPIGLLSDCHRRIERFLGLLATVAGQAHEAALNSDQRHAVETAAQYFKLAAPKHTLDEEDSLFPRLRSSMDPRARSADRLLQDLTEDHKSAEEMHERIDQLFSRWLSSGEISTLSRQRLGDVLQRLTEFYEAHIAIEEQHVFPLARTVLTAAELKSIGIEMAKRRGVDIGDLGRATP